VVTNSIAVGNRFLYPVDIQTKQVQKLTADNGDLGCVYAVRTEQGTTPTLRALKEIIPELLDYLRRKLAAAGQSAQNLPCLGELAPVNGTQKLCPGHRHVAGVAGTKKEMAFVCTCAAAHTDVHEYLEGAMLVESLSHALKKGLFPPLRQIPVLVGRCPVMGIGHTNISYLLWLGGMAKHPGLDLDRFLQPTRPRRV